MIGILSSRNTGELLTQTTIFVLYVIILTFVLRYLWNNVLVDLGRVEALLPRSEQVDGEPTLPGAWGPIALVAANLLSVLLECGVGPCDDDPTYYQMLGKP